jgi:flagellar hook-length control protein FliK
MILVPTKVESVASSPLSLRSLKDEKLTLSFSELLHGVRDFKDEKTPQNGSFVLSLGADTKELKPPVEKAIQDLKLPLKLGSKEPVLTKEQTPKDEKLSIQLQSKGIKPSLEENVKKSPQKESLSSLLKNEDKVLEQDIKSLELNPKITQNISTAELKVLIFDAKKFLKDQILDSVAYKKAEVKDLPKTLKGLAQMAKTFGVDISKITLEEVKSTVKPAGIDLKNLEQVKPREILRSDSKEIKLEIKLVPTEKLGKVEELKQVASTNEVSKNEDEDIPEIKVKTTKIKSAIPQDDSDAIRELKVKEDTKDTKESIKIDDRKLEVVKEVKATPLFKAQEKFEHTTEQLVQTKQFKVEQKIPTSRADETLKLLLRGEKPTSIDTSLGLTKDFSVATARVVAPSATTEATKSIEKLLRGDLGEDVSKPDVLTTNKADSFEVKINEAKQMMKYLSQDVKTAIEDYKSPFTRVKVQLNPAKMGEVDLTVVQRGNNLHVSLSANNTAINTLSMNVNELKVQLVNNGIQNATLNFSNTSQGNEQNAQQQHRQNERQAREEYNYFENEEQNEEILSSLEIVVPNYA